MWQCTDRSAHLVWLDGDVELYLTMDPLTDKESALVLCDALKKYVMDKAHAADLLL